MQLTELVQLTIIIFSIMILIIALVSYTGYKAKNKIKNHENQSVPETIPVKIIEYKTDTASEKNIKVNQPKVHDKFKIFILPDSQQLTRINSKPKHYPHLIKIK